jgi:hypothetical protein
LPQRTQHATWHDSVFFVAGLQFLLLGIALEVVRQGLKETSLTADIVGGREYEAVSSLRQFSFLQRPLPGV